MKIILKNTKEIETQIVDIALTTGGELRAQISIKPDTIDFIELIGDLNAGHFESFTVVRGESSQTFSKFTTVAKATRRMNEYNDDVFVELIHKDFAPLTKQVDGDSSEN